MPGTRLTFVCILALLVVLHGCGNEPYCPEGLSWCWAKCVDLRFDERNCGKCDGKCGLNAYCEDGVCACPFGFRAEGPDCVDYEVCEGQEMVDCSGECVDITSDVGHCGACDNACFFDNAAASCVDGTCVMGDCDQGWADCDHDDVSGCEVYYGSDWGNCGECESLCPGRCVNGECDYSCIVDVDSDGYCSIDSGGDDCDDDDDAVYPGAPEVCDGKDNDCNTETDEDPDACDDGNYCTDDVCDPGYGCVNLVIPDRECDDGDICTVNDRCSYSGVCSGIFLDFDEDGYPAPPCGDDCDDNDEWVNPGINEDWQLCEDGKDNDCDGATDLYDSGCPWSCENDSDCDDDLFCTGTRMCICGFCESAYYICGGPAPECCDEENDVCAGNCFPSSCGDGVVSAHKECDWAPPRSDNCCDMIWCWWVVAGDPDPLCMCSGASVCQEDVCDGGGMCTLTNTADGTACGDGLTCCDGGCVDTETDESHCGLCGFPCTPSEICMNGLCVSQ